MKDSSSCIHSPHFYRDCSMSFIPVEGFVRVCACDVINDVW